MYKAPVYKAAPAYTPLGPAPDPRRWGVWAAGSGNQSNAAGDELVVGSHDRSVSTFDYVIGVDYRVTPYTVAGFAGQVQTFRAPSYSESAASGSSVFALAYDARTTTTVRSELGAWFDWTMPVDCGTTLTLRSRAAWAHDHWSDPSITAMFEALPGSSFTVTGASPARDLLLASAGAEIWFRNGFSLAAWFDGEFAEHSQKYAGTGRLRYTW